MAKCKINTELEVDVLDLPVRALTCLQNAGIKTIGQLCTTKRAELLRYRNFGKKSMCKIDEALERHHLHMGMSEVEVTLYESRIFADCPPSKTIK